MEELEFHSDITFPAEQSIPDEFPVVFPPISYEDFFQTYLAANLPCLIKGGCVDDWRSRTEWAEDGKADLSSLSSVVPASLAVPVSNCGKKYFNSQEQCADYTFGDYLKYWRDRGDDLLYLKDWHFRRDCPDYAAYQTPNWFCSDWLNEYWDEKSADEGSAKDDYRFVYVGPKGSWTPFHSDVFGSFSWSANVVGRKMWTFLPPGQQEQFRDKFGNLPHDLNECLESRDEVRVRKYEVVQESGDVIFVPSLWHHQVVNLEDTISINHNWFNGANAHIILAELLRAFSEVEKELSDCR